MSQLLIAETEWKPIGKIWADSPHDDASVLAATVTFGGASFHAEAIEVAYDEAEGIQRAINTLWDERLDALGIGFGCPDPETVTIKGRTYVVTITPYAK